MFILHKETKGGSMSTATKTMIKSLGWTYGERWVFVIVKWANRFKFFSCFFEIDSFR
jgi:hypothetical protein